MVATNYLEIEDMTNGSNNNTWGDTTDANLAILELAIARYLPLSTTGGTTTLTTAQNRYPLILVTGVLVSNAVITVRTFEKHFVVINSTTGAFTVTIKTSAGTGKTLPRGSATQVYCDGTNVSLARRQVIPHAAGAGTADAITAVFEPATIAAEIQDGYMWAVEALGANTVTAPTFNPDVTGALTIKKNGAQALAVGDIPRAGYKMLLMYDASGTHVELLNPVATAASTTEALTGTDAAKFVTPDALAALWEKGSDIASAGIISIGEGKLFHITGTTTITDIDFATAKDGRGAWLIFDGILTLTHHAVTLILPGSANITTAAGDMAYVTQDSTDNVKVAYFKADGTALVGVSLSAATQAEQETGTSTLVAVTPGRQHFHPSAAKFWARCAGAGTLTESFNMTSVTDTGVGNLDGTIATDFSTATWCLIASIVTDVLDQSASGDFKNKVINIDAQAAGTFSIVCGWWTISTTAANTDVSASDPISYNIAGFGDQA